MRLFLCAAVAALPLVAASQEPDACKNPLRYVSPHMAAFCVFAKDMEATTAQSTARILKKPMPSREIFELPNWRTDQARQTGYACLDGLAVQRVKGGWKQLETKKHEWIRCTDAEG